ncbi:MAG: energy-coupling factor transporter transmembrane protein EcfT [Ardenticatenales bacterium]|nr:energy-coupling factor transporter transmembrane protein EcfT [Ardenticatenales bacterium]
MTRWHPLTKLTLVLSSTLAAYANLLPWAGVPLFPLFATALLLLLLLWDSRATAWLLLRRLVLLLLPLLISLFFVQGFFYPGAKTVLYEIGPFALKLEGLLFGATILSRLVLILSATLALLLTTHPADVGHALTEIGLPHELSYVVLAALQLLPQMQARAARIADAQRARGLRTEGNLLVRARALLPLIGPLIASALHETEERALALEARAFRAPGPKTSWRQLHDTPRQRLARWLMLGGAIALLAWGRLFPLTPF